MARTLLLMLLFVTGCISSQDLSKGLLLQYPFDGNQNDVSGNENHGTSFGTTPTFGTDRLGTANSAQYFNGVDNYVNFPNLSALKPNLPVSFAFWIKYTSVDYHHQVVFNTSFEEDRCTGIWFNSSLTNNGHAINFGDGTYNYSPATRNTFLCTKEIVVDTWHHITVVVNSANDMKIYIDCYDNPGVYSGFGGDLVYSSTPGTIGRHERDLGMPPDYFQGYIDDFRYWDRALTPEDMAVLCEMLSVSEKQVTENTVTIYPNPAYDVLNIQTDLQDIKSMELYNSLGQETYSGAFKSTLDVGAFSPGFYYLLLKSNSDVLTRKIVIR